MLNDVTFGYFLRLISEYGTKGVRDTDTANTPETAH